MWLHHWPRSPKGAISLFPTPIGHARIFQICSNCAHSVVLYQSIVRQFDKRHVCALAEANESSLIKQIQTFISNILFEQRRFGLGCPSLYQVNWQEENECVTMWKWSIANVTVWSGESRKHSTSTRRSTFWTKTKDWNWTQSGSASSPDTLCNCSVSKGITYLVSQLPTRYLLLLWLVSWSLALS